MTELIENMLTNADIPINTVEELVLASDDKEIDLAHNNLVFQFNLCHTKNTVKEKK